MIKRLFFVFLIVALLLGAIFAYLFLADKPIQSVAWDAPKGPALKGEYAANTKLKNMMRIPLLDGHAGAEHIAINAQGIAFMGTENGDILTWDTRYPSRPMNVWVSVKHGRPLGLEFNAKGDLIVADANLGLYSIGSDKQPKILSMSFDNKIFGFADDVAIAKNGDVYFSDATSELWLRERPKLAPRLAELEVIEHAGKGSLYVYRAATGKTEKLLDNLQFANGVALSDDEFFVLVNETGSYQVTRYWLKGDKAGTHDVFINNLPGLPDNITETKDGFWLALLLPRNPLLDGLSNMPVLRDMLGVIPSPLLPKGKPFAHVIKLDKNGKVVASLQAEHPSVHAITTALEHNNKLYLGSLTDTAVGVYVLPQ